MRLEALEALAKLFNNLWFEQIKRDITDSKVQAYLMVFEDAFPHLNHVIEFVRKSADVLTDGSPDREHWSRLQGEFESLRLLLGEEQVQHRPGAPARRQSSPVADTEVTDREKEALGAVDQGDIDALFVEATTEPAPAVDPAPNDIDTLFVEAGAPAAEVDVGQDDIDALFENGSSSLDDEEELDELEVADSNGEQPLMPAAKMEEEADALLEEEIVLEDLLEDEVDDDDSAEADDDELKDLLADGSVDEAADDTEDFGLLEEDDADEEGESDDDDNDVGAGISDEEMTALLEADEDDEEDSGDGKAVAAEAEVEVDSEDEESISQDEIDALFG